MLCAQDRDTQAAFFGRWISLRITQPASRTTYQHRSRLDDTVQAIE